MDILNKIIELLGSAEAIAGYVAMALEYILRKWPTTKMLSILGGIKYGLKTILEYGIKSLEVLSKLDGLLDKAVPQNLIEKKD